MGAKKVLVVDDNKKILELMREYLLELNMEAVLAGDAEEALRLAKTQKIDAILLDIMMPKMQGDEAALLFEKDPATAGVPIVFLTSLAAAGDPQKSPLGEHWVLSKALPPQDLMTKLKELL